MNKRGPKPGSGRFSSDYFLATAWATVQARSRFKRIPLKQAMEQMAKLYGVRVSLRDGRTVFAARGTAPRRSQEETYLQLLRATHPDGERKRLRKDAGPLATIKANYNTARLRRQVDAKFRDECDSQLAFSLLHREQLRAGRTKDEAYETWLASTADELNDVIGRHPEI